jgi:hypothetical protein
LGAPVWVSFAVVVSADSGRGCGTPDLATHKLKLKVVKVFSAPPAGMS